MSALAVRYERLPRPPRRPPLARRLRLRAARRRFLLRADLHRRVLEAPVPQARGAAAGPAAATGGHARGARGGGDEALRGLREQQGGGAVSIITGLCWAITILICLYTAIRWARGGRDE